MKSTPKKLSEIVLEKWRKRKRGHFAVYTKEGKRFVVPLHYLNHPIFRVLLEMAEEEFGSTPSGPLKVPCEEELMNYILFFMRKKKNQHPQPQPQGLENATTAASSIASLFLLFQGELETAVL